MRLKLTCKNCRRNIEIEGNLQTRSIECPNCTAPLHIPSNILDVDEMIGGFQVRKHLGSGSMGCVYLANQVSMDRPVALKVLPPEMTEDEDEIEGFLREVRMLAKLDHPNIVTAFEAGEFGGNYYMAMTFVDGETVEDKVDRDGPLEELDSLKVTMKVAEALKYAWEKHHILHRDVKPENIMIADDDFEPRLLDMGISKSLGEDAKQTHTSHMLVGTPHYMSPEQARAGSAIDFRSDMYSLGCSLYQFLTGEVPYDAPGVMQVLARHANDPFPTPHKYRKDISDATVELLQIMMEKDPDRRFESWDELIREIRSVIRMLKRGDGTRTGRMPKQRRMRMNRNRHAGKTTRSGKTRKAIADEEIDIEEKRPEPIKQTVKLLLFVTLALLGLVGAGIVYLNSRNTDEDIEPTEEDLIEMSSDLSPEMGETIVSGRAPAADSTTIPHEAVDTEPSAPSVLTAKNDERRDRVKMILETARKTDNTTSLAPHIAELKEILEQTELASNRLKRKTLIEELEKTQAERIDMMLKRLKSKAVAQLQKGNHDGAAAVMRDYKGVFDEATAGRRQRLARKYSRQKNLSTMSEMEELEFYDEVARRIAYGQFSRADKLAKDALEDNPKGLQPNILELCSLATEVYAYECEIALSFEKLLGKEGYVPLQSGKEKLLVSKIDGHQITAHRVVKIGASIGRLPRDFEVKDLSVTDRLRRISDGKGYAYAILRGVYALELKQFDKARLEFEKVEHPFVKMLELYANMQELDPEDLAMVEFRRFCSMAGVEPADQNVMIRKVTKKNEYSAVLKTRLRVSLKFLLRRFSRTKMIHDNALFLKTIQGILDGDESASIGNEKAIKMKLNELQALNNLDDLKSTFRKIGAGLSVSLAGNPGLTKLDPILDLPIRELDLVDTSVTDLSQLKELELSSLKVARTPVSSLDGVNGNALTFLKAQGSKLSQIPSASQFPVLEHLDIRYTKISSLDGIEKLSTLTWLAFPRCKSLNVLDALQKLPKLHTLVLPKEVTGLEVLSSIKSLKAVGYSPKNMMKPAEFLKEAQKK